MALFDSIDIGDALLSIPNSGNKNKNSKDNKAADKKEPAKTSNSEKKAKAPAKKASEKKVPVIEDTKIEPVTEDSKVDPEPVNETITDTIKEVVNIEPKEEMIEKPVAAPVKASKKSKKSNAKVGRPLIYTEKRDKFTLNISKDLRKKIEEGLELHKNINNVTEFIYYCIDFEHEVRKERYNLVRQLHEMEDD